ncbi:ABC transporter ATP-binding protein [Acuticoccus sediminis]|uniref:ABC transporter ATP-binding protein n=1 Tax=Acuticoccus sediminis TaxID=2184697 RepID=UPI001CFE4383|nr:dipeptide ABC transporter ATP-binding protein [Acuticoccus sediminis]
MTPTRPLVEAVGLTKHFPIRGGPLGRQANVVRAVDGVDVTIGPGETLGLVGESGCGKTTTGRMLVRLIDPTDGRITFDGQSIEDLDAAAMRAVRRDMQIIFQDPYGSLNPRMSVQDIIAEPLEILKIGNAGSRREQVAELLRVVGLAPYHAERFPHEFSGGQRQRIGIARALAVRPKLVVCDEPVSALDVSIQAQVVNLLKDLQAEFGLTYLFISHDLGVVRHISDRVMVMYLGKAVEVAPKRELYANPQHPYTQALLSAIPIPDPKRRTSRKVIRGDIPSPANPPNGCRFHTRCPHVMDVCRELEPQLLKGAPDHRVACHLVHPPSTARAENATT